VPAAAGRDARECGGDLAVARDELRPERKAVDALDRVNVDVEHPHAGNFAGRDADHGVGETGPPCPHLRFLAAGVFEAVHGERALVVRVAGKDRDAQRQRVVQRGVEHGRDVVHLMY
jgi:hypothetical protein